MANYHGNDVTHHL